jgi:hypothetical protein
MKKILIIVILVLVQVTVSKSQNISDIGRIVLHSAVIDPESKIPTEAKVFLESKLSQIASNNGVGGNGINPRFIIAAKVNITTKDIIAGPPQMVGINTEITFFVGDAITKELYANATISSKGVGTNENKAFIDAIKNINPKNPSLINLVENGKNKIVNYYSQQCDFIITKSKTLADKQNYDEAIYELMQVPDVCKDCYLKCMASVKPIWQKKINRDCTLKLNEAKNKWNASQNSESAATVAELIANIEPTASCYKEALVLNESIKNKLEADEKKAWEFKMKKYADGVQLEQQRIESLKAIAIAYAQNQPKTIIYNRIIW